LLLVDDDQGIRNRLGFSLRKLGVDVDTAATVAEAIHKLTKEGSFDYAFVDLKLPDGDGLDVMRVARSLHVAAYAITGSGDADHHNRGVLLDDVRVLLKPLHGLMLAKVMERFEGDEDRRAQLLTNAIEAFIMVFAIDGDRTYVRRMLETIVEGKSPKETRTSDGRMLTEWQVGRARGTILRNSRLGSIEAVFKWLYDYAFRSPSPPIPRAS
jgi:DNA-binding response OmpR family regulator